MNPAYGSPDTFAEHREGVEELPHCKPLAIPPAPPHGPRACYAISCSSLVPSASRRTLECTATVVVIGVSRGERGRDRGRGARPEPPRRGLLSPLGRTAFPRAPGC